MNRDDILPGTVLTVPGGADIGVGRRRSSYRLIVESVMPQVSGSPNMLYVIGRPIRIGGDLARRYNRNVHRVLWLDQVRPDPHIRVLHLTASGLYTNQHPQYVEHLTQMMMPKLADEWSADAESFADSDVSYVMVTYDGQVAAWAGYRHEIHEERFDEPGGNVVLRCMDNYVARDFRHIKPELWPLAYLARHQLVVAPWEGYAYTYVYTGPGQPADRHMADGWWPDADVPAHERQGVSYARLGGEPHHWVRLVRQPR